MCLHQSIENWTINKDVTKSILQILNTTQDEETIMYAVVAIANLCDHYKSDPGSDLAKAMPTLVQLITRNSSLSTIGSSCRAMAYILSDHCGDLQVVIDSDAIPKLLMALE